jgi:uncharacterized membrane protein
MRIRTILLLLVLVAVAVFSILNWNVFVSPTALSLGVTSVQAPLGLIMLVLLVFLAAFFLVFVVYLQSTVLFDTRRHSKELQAHRALANQAEASRVTELREFLNLELKQQTSQNAASQATVLARLDALDRDLHLKLEQSENSLSAYIAELEDRLTSGRQKPDTSRAS